MQKRSKKGFTLAELLIVVAIIAVLVAIAVPLFVSSLTKAEKARDAANIRAVRGAAVVAILSAEEPTTPSASTPDPNGVYTCVETGDSVKSYHYELKGPWKAVGTLDGSGNITNVTIKLAEGDELNGDKLADTVKDEVNGDTVTVYISITELNKTA